MESDVRFCCKQNGILAMLLYQVILIPNSLRVHAGDCVPIVLVDKCKLRYTAEPPPEEPQRPGVPSCCCGLVRIGYKGHYIVLTAWAEASQAFRVEDPALSGATYITRDCLDRARTSYGTDEDILVVSRCRRGQQAPLANGHATKPPKESSATGQQQSL